MKKYSSTFIVLFFLLGITSCLFSSYKRVEENQTVIVHIANDIEDAAEDMILEIVDKRGNKGEFEIKARSRKAYQFGVLNIPKITRMELEYAGRYFTGRLLRKSNRTVIYEDIHVKPLGGGFKSLSCTIFRNRTNDIELDLYSTNIERKEPPFFRITTKSGRKIYVLGSLHIVPFRMNLSKNTILELKRINRDEGKVVLFTEHEVTNSHPIKKLEILHGDFYEEEEGEEEGATGPERWWTELDRVSQYRTIINVNISGDESKIINLNKLKYIKELWLVFTLISPHVNSLYYSKFGGLEQELESWGWSGKEYLETYDQIAKILETRESIDFDLNVNLVGRLLKCWLSIKNIKFDKKDVRDIWVRSLEGYSWESIKKSPGSLFLPMSVFDRNKLWGKQVATYMGSNTSNLLIVVGNGHLTIHGKNFISYLQEAIEGVDVQRKVHRFYPNRGEQGEWGDVF